jgi:thiol-disulfide isomerase/thioredoxin
MNTSSTSPAPTDRGEKGRRRRTSWFWFGLLLLAAAAWPFRSVIQQRLLERTALIAQAPSSDVVSQTIEGSPDPAAAILAAWSSGYVVPRTVALQELNQLLPRLKPLPQKLQEMILSASLDPDNSVRELALGLLGQIGHPQYTQVLASQLTNADPEIRLLALRHLRDLPGSQGVPLAASQLDADDPRVIGTALNLLGRWTQQDFGVRLADTVSVNQEVRGLPEFKPTTREMALAGAVRAKRWLAEHASEFPSINSEPSGSPLPSASTLDAGDMELHLVSGKTVRLSDFKGRRVIVNFWTTWCSACVAEIPILAELQRRHPNDLVVLGVSLDGVPDEHGHVGGHDGHRGDEGPEEAPTLKELQKQVARFAERRGMTYRIAMDPENRIGGRFNGGELPTTLLIDARGRIHRRFIGARDPEVFEAMLMEL